MADRARIEDWPAIESLLVASGLPLEGAAAAFKSGVIERKGDELVGCPPSNCSAVRPSCALLPCATIFTAMASVNDWFLRQRIWPGRPA